MLVRRFLVWVVAMVLDYAVRCNTDKFEVGELFFKGYIAFIVIMFISEKIGLNMDDEFIETDEEYEYRRALVEELFYSIFYVIALMISSVVVEKFTEISKYVLFEIMTLGFNFNSGPQLIVLGYPTEPEDTTDNEDTKQN